ncbi:ATP/GTP-binding protein [Thalassospira sp.]|uniref:AAA family ATPase n=1 Tax=Thalassospira sp. TaxID=1912094 RepID=UPI002733879B|nr:ATP-binding protein [Thalassospira sp.]MDP2697570.1 ATP-binding protein [Thalassospira sp.]
MILRFSVQNYLSFDEEQEISFIASKLRDRDDGLIDLEHISSGLQGLPVAVVYGANASGKSNLLRALSTMRQLVLFSHSSSGPGQGITRKAFALRGACQNEETKFSIDFVLNNVRYHYGFSFDDEMYREEWLHFYPEGSRRVLFEREAGAPVKFGPSFKGEKKILESLMRENSLFVSVAAQNNQDILGDVFKFFDRISIELELDGKLGIAKIKRGDREFDERSIKFLKLIGAGIVGFRRKNPDESEHFSMFSQILKHQSNFSKILREQYEKFQDLELGHEGKGGEIFYFNIDDESAGTRKIVDILSQIFSVLDRGGFVAIDEIDISVHSQATEAIVALFANKATNPNGAQLLATTHDTNLMASDILRRDEIWLVEKNPEGMSELFPLTDIRTRKQDNIEKGYLEGRYGAVPMVDIRDLIAEVGCGAQNS